MSGDALNFVTPAGATEHYARVLRAAQIARRREVRFDAAKTAAIVGLAALAGWLAWNNGSLARVAAEKKVDFVTVRDDGTVTNSVWFTSLPPEVQNDAHMNALWLYVESRECYNSAVFSRSWYIVQAMSDDRVATEFRDAYGAQNKQSIQHTMGDKGVREDCQFLSYAPVGYDGDGIQVRFQRRETGPRGSTRWQVYSVALRYRTGIYASDPNRAWLEKTTFNQGGVQVWEYPGAQPESVIGAAR